MLANVLTKTVRDRQLAILIGVAGVLLMALLGLGAYSGLDDTIADLYDSMPEAYLAIIGISDVSTAGSLILGQVANLMAPMVLAGLGISMGASVIAGEEAAGTMGLLLGNPKSRTGLVLSKAGAMVLLLTVGAGLIWAGTYGVAAAFNTDMSSMMLGAAMVHVLAISLFFGFFALLLGSGTGRRSVASGASVGLLLLSFLAAGVLPLIASVADLAKVFPWYYFNSSAPLNNGVDWGHLSILIGGTLVMGIGAIVGVNRRDLRTGEGGGGLIERLKERPMMRKVTEKITGRAKVSSIAVKTSTEYQGLAIIAGLAIFYTALIVGPMYNGLSDVLVDLADAMPEAVMAMIGFADMSTPEGWYSGEVFSLVVPAAMIVVTVMMGAKGVAGEEENNTMDLLLSNPIPRSRVIGGKTAAMVLVILGIGVATFLGTAAGSALGGLGIAYDGIAAASFLGVLLGLVFGGVALVVGAGTGNRRTASYAAAGLAFVAYFANAFLPVNDNLAPWAKLSPFYYYQEGEPLVNGLQWGNAAVLAGLFALLVLAAVPLFQRRDVRH